MSGERRILIMGAGGHAKVIIEAIRAAHAGRIVGLIGLSLGGADVLGVPVIGKDDDVSDLFAKNVAHSAVVAVGDNKLRQRIGRWLFELGFELPTIVHPTAMISPSAHLGAGAVIMAGALIGAGTTIGSLGIVNSAACVDHDNDIGAAAHISPGCVLAGAVRVGERVLVGVGSSVRPGVSIGDDATIGAGSAVVSDVAASEVVGGAPAKPLIKASNL
jgi:UDP-perosamine 4-acetyltransferase